MKQYTRKELNEKLRAKIAEKKPLIGSGAANPLIAKILEEAGCDFAFAYCTGVARIGGFVTYVGSRPLGDADERCVRFAHQASAVLTDIPVICGIGPADPTMDVGRLTDRYMALGYSGVINFPCRGHIVNEMGRVNMYNLYAESVGLGVREEARRIKYWHDHDVFSFAYAFDNEALRMCVQAGVDVIIPHLGLTIGGLVGSQYFSLEDQKAMDEQIDKLNEMVEICREENPDTIVIGHGGILSGPEQIKLAFERTDIKGFIGASSTERLPIEQGTVEFMKEVSALTKR